MKSSRPALVARLAASSGRSRSARRRSRAKPCASQNVAREVPPHRDRAEALVQEHDDGGASRARRADPLVLDLEARRASRAAPMLGEAGDADARIGARHARCVALALAQAKALDLAGRRLRQLVDELDRARVLVGRELLLDEGLELVFAHRCARLEHDEGLGLGQALAVLGADHRALEHRRVLHQRRLDLERRDPDAAHLEHVVAAAGVGVVAVGVAHVLVAALGPAALEGLARLLAVAPVHQRRARALDVEVADLAVGDRPAVVAAQLDLVARRPACRCVP